jgi:hypothetical protein
VQEDWATAARLQGAAAAELQAFGGALQRPEADHLRESTEAGVRSLGEDEWQRLLSEGRTLTVPEALALVQGPH